MSNITQSITTQTIQGWTASPNGRGTLDILNSALLTILLCIWSILCIGINSSPTAETTLQQALHKLKLAFLCTIGPDFLLYLAIGQWESARRSCVQFRGLGGLGFEINEEEEEEGKGKEGKGKEGKGKEGKGKGKEGKGKGKGKVKGKERWTMRHAFLADIGGFTLRTKDDVSWPLDANQLFWLIKNNFFSESTIQEEILIPTHEIKDRNKQDSLLRLFTLLQIIWFLITCIGRAWQGLAITTLELTTLGFITTTIGVSGFWWFKPADVSVSRLLAVEVTVGEILKVVPLDDGDGDRDRDGHGHGEGQRVRKRERYYWFETPLDFLNPEKTYFQVGWRYTFNLTPDTPPHTKRSIPTNQKTIRR